MTKIKNERNLLHKTAMCTMLLTNSLLFKRRKQIALWKRTDVSIKKGRSEEKILKKVFSMVL